MAGAENQRLLRLSSPVGGDSVTWIERSRLAHWRTPATELLGMVTEQLRSSLYAADWTDGWRALDTTRFEWAGGLSVTEVVDLLLPVVADGELYGIPGLRLGEVRENAATLQWLPVPPTRLHLTRLTARRAHNALFPNGRSEDQDPGRG